MQTVTKPHNRQQKAITRNKLSKKIYADTQLKIALTPRVFYFSAGFYSSCGCFDHDLKNVTLGSNSFFKK